MLTCFYDLLWLLGAYCSPEEEEAKYHPLTRFALMALARKNGQPMHSQLALTEHASLNLAPLILPDPVSLYVCEIHENSRPLLYLGIFSLNLC